MEKQKTKSEKQRGNARARLPYGRRQTGFTLLLAALAASIALTLGSSIFSISSKQVKLSSIGRDSQFAFYAADTAAECALYWDIRFGYFGTSTPPDPQDQYVCDGQILNASGRPAPNNPAPYPYSITIQLEPSGRCATLTVLKCDGPISAAGVCSSANDSIRTVIRANGFNTTCDKIATSRTAIQRSVELNY